MKSSSLNLKQIKDAARQSFRDQQTQDNEGGVPDAVSFVAGFIQGAKHSQAEVDKLRSIIKDLVAYGLDYDLAARIETLEIE